MRIASSRVRQHQATKTSILIAVNFILHYHWLIFMYLHNHKKRGFQVSNETITMSEQFPPPFLTLPVELVYRILDKLDELTILLSIYNVCEKLNIIINSYHQYRVNVSSMHYEIIREKNKRVCNVLYDFSRNLTSFC
jgi:hypothetical protein